MKKSLLVVRGPGGGTQENVFDRCDRWWKKKRTTISLCLFSVYILLRMGLWIMDFSQSRDSNVFFLESRAKKLAIVVPFFEDEIAKLTWKLRYGWRMTNLKCLPMPRDASWEGHPCGVRTVGEGTLESVTWKPDERYMKLDACQDAKKYGFFVDLIFYLDVGFDQYPLLKQEIQEAIADNPMLEGCYETVIFMSSSMHTDMFDNRDLYVETTKMPRVDFMFFKVFDLFKLPDYEFNAYDFFYWMPLNVQPVRDYWLDTVYEQVLASDQHYFWVKGSSVVDACFEPASSENGEPIIAEHEGAQNQPIYQAGGSRVVEWEQNTGDALEISQDANAPTENPADPANGFVEGGDKVVDGRAQTRQVRRSQRQQSSSVIYAHRKRKIQLKRPKRVSDASPWERNTVQSQLSLWESMTTTVEARSVRLVAPCSRNSERMHYRPHIHMSALYRLNDDNFDFLLQETFDDWHVEEEGLLPNGAKSAGQFDITLHAEFSEPDFAVDMLNYYVFSPFVTAVKVTPGALAINATSSVSIEDQLTTAARSSDFSWSTYLICIIPTE